jgi:hypothetical protein
VRLQSYYYDFDYHYYFLLLLLITTIISFYYDCYCWHFLLFFIIIDIGILLLIFLNLSLTGLPGASDFMGFWSDKGIWEEIRINFGDLVNGFLDGCGFTIVRRSEVGGGMGERGFFAAFGDVGVSDSLFFD